MARSRINILKSTRVRNLIVVGITIFFVSLFFAEFVHQLKNQSTIPLINPAVIFVTNILLCSLFIVFPFGHFIERTGKSTFETYFEVARVKLGKKTYLSSEENQIVLEQGEDKFYCISIKLENLGTLMLERYPSLDTASERMAQLQNALTE